eukprot:SAG22_NODE_9790_length_569_cov_1.317021_1_plen_70_part_00
MLTTYHVAIARRCNGMIYSTEAAVAVDAAAYYNIEVAAVFQLTDIFYAGFFPIIVPVSSGALASPVLPL